MPERQPPWWSELTRYHWFVLLVAALGWLFDTMDQQLFVLVRLDALTELIRLAPNDPTLIAAQAKDASITAASFRPPADHAAVRAAFGQVTAIFLIGWACGGLGFGILGDKIGRVKTMLVTILLYSVFTGLSSFAAGYGDFCVYRFLTGLGVGGEFAVGVALVAETMPNRARPYALTILQASSGIGNIAAALIYLGLGQMESAGAFAAGGMLSGWALSPWRIAFLIGAVPALLAILIRRRLKEPEAWKQSAAKSKDELGSYAALLGTPRWRTRALGGLLLGFSAVVGLWGIGFFMPELLRATFRSALANQGLEGAALAGAVKTWVGVNSIFQNLGGMAGILCVGWLAQSIGRKVAFALAFLAALASTATVFATFSAPSQVFWLIPIMGFCQLALFGLLAMYLPELFPTTLRSTGTSFCYNVGRFVAAVGPQLFGFLTASVFVGPAYPNETPLRYAGVTMCGVFLLGLFALPFLPETKGKPLPE